MTERKDPHRCADWQACLKHDNERVELVGRYTLDRPLAGMKGGADIVRVRIVPDGGRRGPYLAPYWHAEATRSKAEIERLEGKAVRIVGRLHLTAPNPPGGDTVATHGGACIHPVESVQVAAADD